MVVGQTIFSTEDDLSIIQQGTRITAIDSDPSSVTYRKVTLNKAVRASAGASITVGTTSGNNTEEIVPGTFDFVPQQGDAFEITAIGDKKVSINPAIQLTDYLLNSRYGRGLDLEKDINLDSIKSAARLCDTRSDVSVIMPNDSYTNDNAWLAAVAAGTDKWLTLIHI